MALAFDFRANSIFLLDLIHLALQLNLFYLIAASCPTRPATVFPFHRVFPLKIITRVNRVHIWIPAIRFQRANQRAFNERELTFSIEASYRAVPRLTNCSIIYSNSIIYHGRSRAIDNTALREYFACNIRRVILAL